MKLDKMKEHTKNKKLMDRVTSGFSLIELLAVVAIITILVSMIGVAAHSARQRAYATQARLEAQQVATAFRSYWVTQGSWPTGFDGGYKGAITKSKLFSSDLMGGGQGDVARSPFLEISEEDFYGSEEYLDPWGHPYQLNIEPATDVEHPESFQVIVGFLNSERYYYQE